MHVYCEKEPKYCALAQANTELAAATEKLEVIREKLLANYSSWAFLYLLLVVHMLHLSQEECPVTVFSAWFPACEMLEDDERLSSLEKFSRWNEVCRLSKKRIGASPLKTSKHRRKLSWGDILLTAGFVSHFGTFIKHHQDPKGHVWIPPLKTHQD
ncbi:dynein axonemal heavy chain 11-like [Agelaius tricolor]|uniref:dynein axonemal heavy chain 11-like n=1 Tax=Agelaius tricolor TaxID=9191 RepID=UPI0039F1DF4F